MTTRDFLLSIVASLLASAVFALGQMQPYLHIQGGFGTKPPVIDRTVGQDPTSSESPLPQTVPAPKGPSAPDPRLESTRPPTPKSQAPEKRKSSKPASRNSSNSVIKQLCKDVRDLRTAQETIRRDLADLKAEKGKE